MPQYYTANDFPSQYGQRVHDCVGLIKGYIWSDGPDAAPAYGSNGCPDINETQMLTNSKEKGPISTLPEIPGTPVYFSGHVGVYIGNGEVIEARGHAYGVVKTKLKDRPWTHWGKCPYITYENNNNIEEDDDMVRYARLSDIPNNNGFRDIVETLMNAKIILGDGSDPVGNNDVIDLSHNQVRSLVFEYRGGAFDRKLIAMGMTPAVGEQVADKE